MRGEDARGAGLWPSIPAVLRVMTGWFFLGIGLLDLAVEMDGGLTAEYLLFHVVLAVSGVLLLTRHKLNSSRAGHLVAWPVALAGLGLSALPESARCCMAAYPRRRGYPFPFLGTGAGTHVDPKYLVIDVIFWGCVGLVLLTLVAVVERRMPERRTPVDLTRYGGHAEAYAYAATPDRTDENVGGLT
ncbi:hypothetical protein [Actinoplanes aureus]|jgi:hypothetical protein|uniref:Uncharacterized protein n=1 Tax=Actinoplanes aureus TaxID=2792083 RepID=A0A931C1M6_9ACTN|nr:hypothetical protein [Actinoplanes aureus]MBG0561665.1 hypothetical protein [Actinoplanes aureus]